MINAIGRQTGDTGEVFQMFVKQLSTLWSGCSLGRNVRLDKIGPMLKSGRVHTDTNVCSSDKADLSMMLGD